MLPLLYNSLFRTPSPSQMKYLGRLTKCGKCTVSERINSDYQLSLVIAPTDELINEVKDQRFILAKPSPFDDPQYFEIYNCVYDQVGQLTVTARHIKHCAYNNLITKNISDTQPQAVYPQNHWNECVANLSFNNYFTFDTNILTSAVMSVGITKMDTLGVMLEEMATAFGGEYHYDNFDIHFLQRRGSRKNYTLRWNKNVGSTKLTLSGATVYSHIVMYGNISVNVSGGKTAMRVCSSAQPIAGAYQTTPINKILIIDASNQLPTTEIPYSQIGDIKTDLNALAVNYANNIAPTAVQTAPSTNLTVNFRPALDEMSAIGLGDTVDVMLKGGRTIEAKIMKTVYNVLSERWESIELGQELLKLSDYIAKTR